MRDFLFYFIVISFSATANDSNDSQSIMFGVGRESQPRQSSPPGSSLLDRDYTNIPSTNDIGHSPIGGASDVGRGSPSSSQQPNYQKGSPDDYPDEEDAGMVDLEGTQQMNLCSDGSPSVKFTAGGKETCNVTINSGFGTQIKQALIKCISETMGNPSSIKIEHMGICSNRKARGSSKWSQHKACAAMDISSITVDGRKLSMNIGKNGLTQYNQIRKCWKREGEEIASDFRKRGQGCIIDSIGHNHSHEPANGLHHDHLHISFNCPERPGYIKI